MSLKQMSFYTNIVNKGKLTILEQMPIELKNKPQQTIVDDTTNVFLHYFVRQNVVWAKDSASRSILDF